MKLWQKYLLKQLVSTFTFLLFALFAIYLIINLSEQGAGMLVSKKIPLQTVGFYYLCNFLVYLDLFFPLAFLLATLKVLLDLNSHHELVALQIGGFSKKMILLPFFLFGMVLCFISYLNTECFSPRAHEAVDSFWNTHSKRKKKKIESHLHTLPLEDNSELVYQTYFASEQMLYDVIWVQSKKELWRIENLDLKSKEARQVEHLVRDKENLWTKTDSFPMRLMEEMPLGDISAMQRFVPFENRSLSSLFRQMRTRLPDRAMAQAHFFYKATRPLLPLVALIAIAPFAMNFKRGRSYFLLFACSLGCFFAFMTILDGMLLIGETHLMPAALAILSPFVCVLTSSFRSFSRL